MYALHSLPGLPADKYDEGADKGLFVAVQIESRQGVENVEEIAKVEGLDILLIGESPYLKMLIIYKNVIQELTLKIGPFDLAKQMNVVRGGEEHEAAIQRTLKAAKAAGKMAAIFCRCYTNHTLSCFSPSQDHRDDVLHLYKYSG